MNMYKFFIYFTIFIYMPVVIVGLFCTMIYSFIGLGCYNCKKINQKIYSKNNIYT